jgi:transaldolase
MQESPLKRLSALGQSPWLDHIQRGLIESGELTRMIEKWGLRGMTSNPAIFQRAIAETHEYIAAIVTLARSGKTTVEIYETLAVEDVRAAADAFLRVYDATDGADGFVSLEVSPHLARDAARTVAEARRLWTALGKPNVMIKVPATHEGLIAVRELLAEGINVNVTLLFSVSRYREVLEAYWAGLDAALEAGRRIDRVASVASFFLSRIDTLIDRELDRLAERADAQGRSAAALRGEIAIASARCAYRVLHEDLESDRFRRFAAAGARPQRLLWASTGTKDPIYSDVKYVEPLIGPHTVNTMPLETLKAYHDHGRPALRLAEVADSPDSALSALVALGIDLDEATDRLLNEGIEKFVAPYEALLRSLDRAKQGSTR